MLMGIKHSFAAMTAQVVFIYYREAKLKNYSLSGDIFTCPSKFPQTVQIAMLIPYRKVICLASLLRSSNLCVSIFFLNSESINKAAFSCQLTSKKSKNFWRSVGTYVSRDFCNRDVHRAGESFLQLSRW